MDSGLCIYQFFVWSNFSFLHNYQWITFHPQSCLVLYSFMIVYWIRLFCDWLFHIYYHVTYTSYFLCLVCFCFGIVFMALFCAAIRWDSASVLRFSFLSHVLIFSCDISLACRLKRLYSSFSSRYFCPVNACVVCIVSGGYNENSSAFVMFLSSFYFDASSLSSMLAVCFHFHFLSHNLSTICLLDIVISFLVLWSLTWTSSLLLFKHSSVYLTRGTAQVFIPLMRFLL